MHALLRVSACQQHVLSDLGADRRALPRKGAQNHAPRNACKARLEARRGFEQRCAHYASSTTKRGTARSGVRGACKEQRSALLQLISRWFVGCAPERPLVQRLFARFYAPLYTYGAPVHTARNAQVRGITRTRFTRVILNSSIPLLLFIPILVLFCFFPSCFSLSYCVRLLYILSFLCSNPLIFSSQNTIYEWSEDNELNELTSFHNNILALHLCTKGDFVLVSPISSQLQWLEHFQHAYDYGKCKQTQYNPTKIVCTLIKVMGYHRPYTYSMHTIVSLTMRPSKSAPKFDWPPSCHFDWLPSEHSSSVLHVLHLFMTMYRLQRCVRGYHVYQENFTAPRTPWMLQQFATCVVSMNRE